MRARTSLGRAPPRLAQGTQWNGFPVPTPVHAPAAHPAQVAQSPPWHCASLVHQQGTPAAVHVPPGDVTVEQLPIGQEKALAIEVAVRQLLLSADPLPVQVPEHWLWPFTHLPLEQSESATQRQADLSEFSTGGGDRLVLHDEPPVMPQATELGATWQPCPSSCAPLVPVQAGLEQCEGMHLPLAQAASEVQ